jgi:hypothetical protein
MHEIKNCLPIICVFLKTSKKKKNFQFKKKIFTPHLTEKRDFWKSNTVKTFELNTNVFLAWIYFFFQLSSR